MADLFVVEIIGAPDRENRFAMCHSGVLTDITDVQFVQLNKVVLGSRKTGFKARHTLDFNKRVVDLLHERVKIGGPETWLSTARVVRYIPATGSYEPIYTGVEVAVAPLEDNPPAVKLAFDGTFRYVPIEKFDKTFRGWRLPYLVMFQGQPHGSYINGATKTEIVEELFGDFELYKAIVSDLPLAHPSDVPEPPAEVVEYIPTQAELDAAPLLDYMTWFRTPTEEDRRRRVFDPIYNASVMKTIARQAAKEKEAKDKLDQEAEAERLRKLKQDYLKKDADEARKTGAR